MKMSRRTFVQAAAAAPAAAVPFLRPAELAAAAAGSAVSGRAAGAAGAGRADRIWDRGARPDYTLSVAAQEMDLFGQKVPALIAGGTWPGAAVRYSKGDRFRVLVENRLEQPTSLHWHGLIVPNLEDGVPSVTQAPIGPGDAVYYEFTLQQTGTYWYHSHFGLQEQQGLGGPLIIEDPDEPHAYDEDIVVMLNDVSGIPVGEVIPKIRAGALKVSVSDPYTRADGSAFPVDMPYLGYLLNGRTPDKPWTQALKAGSRARLRLINGSGSSFFRIAIDGLPLTVIAADGEPVAPVTVDNLIIGTAQRYDVLVTLPASGSHTLHAAALGDDKQALGVLHTPDVAPAANTGRPAFAGRALRPGELKSPYPTALPARPRKTFEVALGGDMRNYLWTMNNKIWPEPFAEFAGDTAERSYYDVESGDVVRFDFVNRTPMAHPMHLHGHVFRVLPDGMDPADSANAPIRDTVVVWPKGKVSIEFVANNPGKWFFHCHNVWHLAVGMAQAVQYKV